MSFSASNPVVDTKIASTPTHTFVCPLLAPFCSSSSLVYLLVGTLIKEWQMIVANFQILLHFFLAPVLRPQFLMHVSFFAPRKPLRFSECTNAMLSIEGSALPPSLPIFLSKSVIVRMKIE
uniref:Uncharacterized protein n=1 Tax=Caenorhabditis tropicalis TaxID=1561998 RepID=A0A1I7U013_9PELO